MSNYIFKSKDDIKIITTKNNKIIFEDEGVIINVNYNIIENNYYITYISKKMKRPVSDIISLDGLSIASNNILERKITRYTPPIDIPNDTFKKSI